MTSRLPAYTALGRAEAYALTHHHGSPTVQPSVEAMNNAFTQALHRSDYGEAAALVLTVEEAAAPTELVAQMRALLAAARVNTAAVEAILAQEAAATNQHLTNHPSS